MRSRYIPNDAPVLQAESYSLRERWRNGMFMGYLTNGILRCWMPSGAETRNDGGFYQSSHLPSNTFMLKEKSCFTRHGSFGSCSPIRACYTLTRLPHVNQLDLWAVLTSGTCQYADEDGNQVIEFSQTHTDDEHSIHSTDEFLTNDRTYIFIGLRSLLSQTNNAD